MMNCWEVSIFCTVAITYKKSSAELDESDPLETSSTVSSADQSGTNSKINDEADVAADCDDSIETAHSSSSNLQGM